MDSILVDRIDHIIDVINKELDQFNRSEQIMLELYLSKLLNSVAERDISDLFTEDDSNE